MKIIYRGEGQRNYVSDENDVSKLNYNGRIMIEIRGSSSQSLPKKQYGFETVKADNSNNNVSLLGMPEENDWVLNGFAFDASMMRDYLSYNLSRQIGNYAPRQRYCEVIINNDYQGLYVLQEKIKIDDNRVNITKMETTDISGEALTGGYLIKADKVTAEDPSSWTMPTHLGGIADFIHEDPKPSEIYPSQRTYIRSVFNSLAFTTNNAAIATGFPSVIDVPSFIDFMLVNELAANVDAYQFSTFFHKDRNSKLRAGPLWDLNLTFGNDLTMWGFNRSFTDTWQFDNGDNVGPRFWRDLYNNSVFRCYLAKRWNELTQPEQPLHPDMIFAFIDETVELISEAVVREDQRWGTIIDISKNIDHQKHINDIKDFIEARVAWMTDRLGSYAACANVTTPPLVITAIDYHPDTSPLFPDDDKQEFIEIVNTGSSPVTLTGIYFVGTGFVFHFPSGTVLPGNAVIQIANDRATFRRRHGYEPYGVFSRNLSNKSEKLTLVDAFGNIIDEVEYSDSAPWPDADGNGKYLRLLAAELDNNEGTNWTATDATISSTEVIVAAEESPEVDLSVWPNPASDFVEVSSPAIIQRVHLTDMQGRVSRSASIQNNYGKLSLKDVPPGLLLLSIQTAKGTVVRKLVVK